MAEKNFQMSIYLVPVVPQLRVDAEDDVIPPAAFSRKPLNPSAKVSCLLLCSVEQSIEHQKILLEVIPLGHCDIANP